MKSIYLVLLFGLSIIVACDKGDGMFDVLPEGDEIALEGMGEAYEHAFLYNDSLSVCHDEPMSCDADFIARCDEQFHQFDEMFDLHHNNYSHNNFDDDHHHEGNNNVHHGGMMNHHPDDGHKGGEDHGYEHNFEAFQMMVQLREIHERVHPG